MWACSLNGNITVVPVLTGADVRSLYTPSLSVSGMDRFPTVGSRIKTNLACGEYFELSMTSDITLLVVPFAVDIITGITSSLGNSSLQSPTSLDSPTLKSSTSKQSQRVLPYQITLTGQLCRVFVAMTAEERASLDTNETIIPVLMLSIQNPVFVQKTISTQREMTLSIFNVSALASEREKHILPSEIINEKKIKIFFPRPLFEARQGLPLHDQRGVYPSLLTFHHISALKASEESSKVWIELGRPLKLSVSFRVLEVMLKCLNQLQSCLAPLTQPHQCTKLEVGEEGAAPSKDCSKDSFQLPHLCFKTSQFIFEYTDLYKQTRVGVSFGWERLKVEPKCDSLATVKLSLCWVKMADPHKAESFIVLPTTISANVQQHLPHSPHDRLAIYTPLVYVSLSMY